VCSTELDTREPLSMTPIEIASMSDTPAKLLALAIANRTPPDTLKQLMDLQERWEKNVARKEYVQAMSEFKKSAPPAIIKQSKVDFTSGKGRTHYNYANLGDVTTQVTPLLAKQGLHAAWETAMLKDGPITVTCHITHAAGHRESVTLSGPADQSGNKNAMQAIGSAVTYLQRYTLLAALGLATMEDDDGSGGVETPTNVKENEQTQDPWLLALQTRNNIPALKALLDAAEKDNLPTDYTQAVKDKIASLTPTSNAAPKAQTADPSAASKTAELARQVNQQFPAGVAGTVQQGNTPGTAPTPPHQPAKPASNGGKFPWKTASPEARTSFAMKNIKAATTQERVNQISKGVPEADVGRDNYAAIMRAATERKRELAPPPADAGNGSPFPESDETGGLKMLLAEKKTVAEFDELAARWQADSGNMSEEVYNAGQALIARARAACVA